MVSFIVDYIIRPPIRVILKEDLDWNLDNNHVSVSMDEMAYIWALLCQSSSSRISFHRFVASFSSLVRGIFFFSGQRTFPVRFHRLICVSALVWDIGRLTPVGGGLICPSGTSSA